MSFNAGQCEFFYYKKIKSSTFEGHEKFEIMAMINHEMFG
jgi:hypothetical protein